MVERKVIAIIPVHNEAKGVPKLVRSLRRCLRAGVINDFVFIENGSRDATASVAQRLAPGKVISLKEPSKGAAIFAGAKLAKNRGFNTIVTLDGDLEVFSPSAIKKIVDPLFDRKKPMLQQVIAAVLEPRKASAQHYEMAVETGFFPNEKAYYDVGMDESGIRAFKVSMLEPVFRGNPRWVKALLSRTSPELALTALSQRLDNYDSSSGRLKHSHNFEKMDYTEVHHAPSGFVFGQERLIPRDVFVTKRHAGSANSVSTSLQASARSLYEAESKARQDLYNELLMQKVFRAKARIGNVARSKVRVRV
ncbi:MAG: glycosyltransferase [archaeon]